MLDNSPQVVEELNSVRSLATEIADNLHAVEENPEAALGAGIRTIPKSYLEMRAGHGAPHATYLLKERSEAETQEK